MMKRSRSKRPSGLGAVPGILALSYGVFAASPPARGDTILLPPDLKPGQTFQIAFLTSGTTSALSSEISYYNNFVTNAAAAAGLDVVNGQSVTWNAIFSTSTIDARDNAPQTSAVYNLDMQLVTPNPGGLWNTIPRFLSNPINVTEQGDTPLIDYVWTGSDILGRYSSGPSAGRDQLLVGIGEANSIFPNWLSSAYFPASHLYHLYALSSPITVIDPNQPPVPGPGDPGTDPGGDPGTDPGGDPGTDPGGDPGDPSAVPEASSIRLGILGLLSMMTRWAAGRGKAPRKQPSR